MTVLVFGAAGFVGRNLVKKLAEKPHDVVASDVVEDPFNGSFLYRKVDILDGTQVLEAVKKIDVIVHLAASPLTVSLQDPARNMKVNLEGTLNILDAARKNDVNQVIYSSASSVVGSVRSNPVDENHLCEPKTPYAVAKRACEDYLRVYNELYGLRYLVFRFFNVYGPWQTHNSGALIPVLHRNLSEGKELQVYGDGSNTRDFVFVGDVTDFCCAAIDQHIENSIINMGTGKGTSIIELINLASKLLGTRPKIAYKRTRPGEISNFVADTARLVQVFGRKPSTPLEEGLKRTFSWLGTHDRLETTNAR